MGMHGEGRVKVYMRNCHARQIWWKQVGEAGVIPSLLRMCAWEAVEAQDCGVGALANLATVPRCKEMIADAGVDPLIRMLSQPGVEEHILDMAVGTIANLATLKPNQAYFQPPLDALLFSSGYDLGNMALATCVQTQSLRSWKYISKRA